MNEQKLAFIQKEFMPLIRTLNMDTLSKWGKMNAQQMVEHVTAFFKVSTDKIKMPLVSDLEHMVKLKLFLHSENQFRENTKAPLSVLPEHPLPTYYATLTEAEDKLEKEINAFIQFFAADPERKTTHPVFGELNYEEWVLLHYKHCWHHAKQFGLVE